MYFKIQLFHDTDIVQLVLEEIKKKHESLQVDDKWTPSDGNMSHDPFSQVSLNTKVTDKLIYMYSQDTMSILCHNLAITNILLSIFDSYLISVLYTTVLVIVDCSVVI